MPLRFCRSPQHRTRRHIARYIELPSSTSFPSARLGVERPRVACKALSPEKKNTHTHTHIHTYSKPLAPTVCCFVCLSSPTRRPLSQSQFGAAEEENIPAPKKRDPFPPRSAAPGSQTHFPSWVLASRPWITSHPRSEDKAMVSTLLDYTDLWPRMQHSGLTDWLTG